MLIVATDGSCRPNPGPGGWAWVDEYGNFRCGAFTHGTNNVGELTAVLYAMLDHPDQDLEIQYDSEYAVNCIIVWGPNWMRQGIIHTKKNPDLIKRCMDVLSDRNARGVVTTWTKVKGHSGHPLNEAVDKVAGSMQGKPDGLISSGSIKLK